jgi:dimethylhistidine N-methyltransferase
LPWYPITRAEIALLQSYRLAILEAAGRHPRVVELGPGNGEKLATLMQDGSGGAPPFDVHLVDVSATALDAASARLRRLPGVAVHTHVARYEVGLREVTQARSAGETLLVAFLGSNIGNFDPPEAAALLQDIRGAMEHGDTLLIGADLVKPVEQLQVAYDDPLGVTAAFNCNLLVRLNRELGADFDLEHFAHDARWNPRAQRMEMHLVSLTQQRVRVPGAGLVLDFHAGETIWTESSYKYEPEAFGETLWQAGFSAVASWQDRDAGFLLTLAAAR